MRATVKIQGAGELKGDGCFKLINDANLENVLNSANFKLSKIVIDEAILTISTNQIISEPITSMVITTTCNTNIRRDYTLLLDPPTAIETKNSLTKNQHYLAMAR